MPANATKQPVFDRPLGLHTVAAPAGPSTAPLAAPQPVDNAALSALQLLLRVENEAREAQNLRELRILMANETRKLTRAGQIFVVERTAAGRLKVAAVSSVVAADANAALSQSIERVLAGVEKQGRIAESVDFQADTYDTGSLDALERYPFREFLWEPLKGRKGKVFAGLLQVREIAWTERDKVVSQRLAATYAHAWRALTGKPNPARSSFFSYRIAAGLLLLAALAMLIPVPMSALAPAEIVAHQPTIVTAPIDGVIERVEAEPNAVAKAGQVLLTFADTTLRNKFEIAEREVLVARARLKRANQLAFEDIRGRHELGIARTELALRIAERDYTRDLLDKAVVRAAGAGIAVFRDKKDLIGKPVAVGERLMELADPGRVLLRIDMPVSDGQLLKPGAAAKSVPRFRPAATARRPHRACRLSGPRQRGRDGILPRSGATGFEGQARAPPRHPRHGPGLRR